MSVKHPIKQVMENLANEFQTINTICLHFDVHVNAMIEERTNEENGKLLRRFCRCLRIVEKLKPETSTFYKDKSDYILLMLHQISAHYDDLKRRYFWALDRLAEMTIKANRLAEVQLRKEPKITEFGESWKDLCRQIILELKEKNRDKEKSSPSIKSKAMQDIDKLSGMMLLGNENKTENKRQETSGTVYTKISRSSNLIKIEDLPRIQDHQSGDHYKRNKSISKKLSKLRKPKKTGNHQQANELEVISDIKMQMYALMEEVTERDEMIASLIAQMEIKDTQIARLAEVIRFEKLGFEKNLNTP